MLVSMVRTCDAASISCWLSCSILSEDRHIGLELGLGFRRALLRRPGLLQFLLALLDGIGRDGVGGSGGRDAGCGLDRTRRFGESRRHQQEA